MVALGSAPDGMRWRPEGIPPSHDHLLPLLITNQASITLATMALSLTLSVVMHLPFSVLYPYGVLVVANARPCDTHDVLYLTHIHTSYDHISVLSVI
jgi:hypothetical protein